MSIRSHTRRPTVTSLHSPESSPLHRVPGRNRPRATNPSPISRMMARIRISRSGRAWPPGAAPPARTA